MLTVRDTAAALRRENLPFGRDKFTFKWLLFTAK